MMEFDEYKFKQFLTEEVGFPIRKANGKKQNPKADVSDEIQEAIDDLSPMDLACYLGAFLSETNTPRG